MAFRIDITSGIKVPSQLWEDAKFSSDFPEHLQYIHATIAIVIKEGSGKPDEAGGVINFEIISPMNETSQQWRNVVYGLAATASQEAGGCSRYYRGTDDTHIRRHHTYVGEAAFNHNHYRVDDGLQITGSYFEAFMSSLLVAQEVAVSEARSDSAIESARICQSMPILSEEAAADIVEAYKQYFTAQIDSAHGESLCEAEYADTAFKLTDANKAEMGEFGHDIELHCHADVPESQRLHSVNGDGPKPTDHLYSTSPSSEPDSRVADLREQFDALKRHRADIAQLRKGILCASVTASSCFEKIELDDPHTPSYVRELLQTYYLLIDDYLKCITTIDPVSFPSPSSSPATLFSSAPSASPLSADSAETSIEMKSPTPDAETATVIDLRAGHDADDIPAAPSHGRSNHSTRVTAY